MLKLRDGEKFVAEKNMLSIFVTSSFKQGFWLV